MGEPQTINIVKISSSIFIVLLLITVLAGTIMVNTSVSADDTLPTDTDYATASVNVSAACSMSSTVDTAHSANITPGTWQGNIGQTSMTVICNDPGGYAIYAVGYSNDEWKNTNLISTNGSTIGTNTNTSGNTSGWSMKLSTGTAPTTSGGATIISPYNDYAIVPGGSASDPSDKQGSYAKVATYSATTTGTTGSSLTSTYGAYVTSAQPAGTYTGKVKYTLVHPNDAPAPELEPTTKYMQDVATWGSALNVGDEITAIDSRDNKEYYVAKLADGNIWMTQNLDFDIDSTKTYTSADTDISADWTPSTSTYTTGTTTWENSFVYPESYDPGNVCWDGILDDTGTSSCSAPNHYHIGNYYTWTAAIAMNDSTSYTTDQTDVDQSICPAGWRLPTYSGNRSYDKLVTDLSLTAGSETYTGADGNIQDSPVYFPYAGFWGGSQVNVGVVSVYWSSVVKNVILSYGLAFNVGGSLDLQGNNLRSGGYSVRCVAR